MMIRRLNMLISTTLALMLIMMLFPSYPVVYGEGGALEGAIEHDPAEQTVRVSNGGLTFQFDYADKLVISSIKQNGVELLDARHAAISAVQADVNAVTLSASYTNAGDSLAHLNDNIISFTEEPRNRWTGYRANKQPVASDWIMYTFADAMTFEGAELYFFEDGGYIAPPESYTIEYWNGTEFVEVSGLQAIPAVPTGNMLNSVTFDPVHTDRLRLTVVNQPPGGGKTAYYSGLTELSFLSNGQVIGKNGVWNGTESLAASPTVNVSQDRVIFTDVQYKANGIPIDETWEVSLQGDAIGLEVSRTYGGDLVLNDQKTLSFGFIKDRFDVIQRTEDGGSFQLLDPGYNELHEQRSLNRFLSRTPYTTDTAVNPENSSVIRTGSWYDNDKYSFYTANMDFIDKVHEQILGIELVSNRDRATRIWREPLAEGGALVVDHKLGKDPLSLGGNTGSFSNINGAERYLPLRIFQNNNFLPVTVNAGQTDIAKYTFKSENTLDKYYDIGTIPASAGIDAHVLAQYIQDYGRSSVIDLNVGMGDTDISGMGPYETWWYSRNALALQGAGNEQYLETLKNFVRFIKDYNYPIHNSGQLYAVSARESVWYKDYFFDTYGQFIAGIAAIYDLSADTAWLMEVKDMARSVLDWAAFTRDLNNDGLMESFRYEISQWDDQSKIGQNSAYANAFLYKALIDWADLERNVFKDDARADRYLAKAAQLKETYNRNVDEGGFWSEATQSFVHSRALDGTIYGDVAHTFENTYSIIFGLVDDERAKAILDEYTRFREGDNILGQPLELFPAQRYPYSPSENSAPFPSYLHGSSFPQMTYDMMAAYAAIGNTRVPAELLKTLVLQYEKDGLIWNTYTWDLQPDTLREPWMSANVRPAAGFYDIIAGIKPKYDRLVIDPALDPSLYGLSLRYKLRGESYRITHFNAKDRELQASAPTQVEMVWRGLEDDKFYLVTDTSAGNSRKAVLRAEKGVVTYTAEMNGTHQLTIAPITLESAVSLNDVLGTNPSGDAIVEDVVLPTLGRNGEVIVWSSSDEQVIALDGSVTRPSFEEGNKQVQLIAHVIGDDMSYQLVFDLTVLKLPNTKAALSSNVLTIDEAFGIISGIRYGISIAQMLHDIEVPEGADIRFLQGDGVTPVAASAPIVSGMRIVSTSQDGKEQRSYTLFTKKENLVFNPSKEGYPRAEESYAYTTFEPNAWKTVDGIISFTDQPHSRWHNYRTTNSGSEWLSYHFGEEKRVNQVDLYVYAPGGIELPPTYITIQVMEDNQWKNVDAVQASPIVPAVGLNRFTFPEVSTEAVRIVMGFNDGQIIGVTETEVFGLNHQTAIASSIYEIDTVNGTIGLPSESVAYAEFIGRLKAIEGATIEVYESDGVTLATGSVQAGMKVVVVAEDGETKQTYMVKALSGNADLRSLSTSVGTLSPVFDPDVLRYTLEVDADVTEVAVVPQADDEAATIWLNGSLVASGVLSFPVPLTSGNTDILVEVTAENGHKKTYVITVTKPLVVVPQWQHGSSLSASSIGRTAISLVWPPAQGAVERFRITYGDQVRIVDGTETSYTVDGLQAGTSYTFTVQAGNDAGWTIDGPTATFRTQDEPTSTPGPSPGPGSNPSAPLDPDPTSELESEPTQEPMPDSASDSAPEPDPSLTPDSTDEPAAPAASLPHDVPAQHWAAKEIQSAIAQGFIVGYDDGSFKPDQAVTRAEIAAMIGRAFAIENSAAHGVFADEGDIPLWAQPYVAGMAESKIMVGYSDGTFRAKQGLTRSELAVILIKLLGIENFSSDTLVFADWEEVPTWARSYVATAYANGIMIGTGNNRFLPMKLVTRAEVAAILIRLQERDMANR